MDADGWITPSKQSSANNPSKRPKLENSTADVIDVFDDSSDEIIELTPPPKMSSKEFESATKLKPLPSSAHSPKSSPRVAIDVKQPLCQYGAKCYRKNPSHLMEFCHPLQKILQEMETSDNFAKIPENLMEEFNAAGMERRVLLEQIGILRDARRNTPSRNNDDIPSTSSASSSLDEIRAERRKKYLEAKQQELKSGTSRKSVEIPPAKRNKSSTMGEKWEASCPFNFFLTSVTQIQEEQEGVFSAGFKDLFCPTLGAVKAVLHVNFMVDPEWLMEQTHSAGIQGKPTRIIFNGAAKELEGLSRAFPWVKVFGVKSPFPFGHHHTKMSIVQYEDNSLRFIVYTANLIESDWESRTQGIWISPKCPKIEGMSLSSAAQDPRGESVTKFRGDVIQYLATYPIQATRAWIDVIRTADCSAIKVYFIGSAPVTASSGSNGFQWGHCKMEKILKGIPNSEVDPNWPLVIQCSSIGTLGKGVEDWVGGELGSAFSGKDRIIRAPIKVVYPTHLNVKGSFEGLHGGGCLPYSGQTHCKQTWLEKHLFQWKASRSSRSRAVPHIKSYFRLSPDNRKISWFLLTSANLSKAAWGKLSKNNDRLGIMSWEAGILFLPHLLVSEPSFSLDKGDKNAFPLPIDTPLVKYEKGDKPWLFDTLQALILQSMRDDD